MRQFRHIELTRNDALALRELMRPFDSSLPADMLKLALTAFAVKIYAALIDLELTESVNIEVSEDECLLINQKVGNEDWEGALPLLRQTWAVLYELKHDTPPGMRFDVKDFLREMVRQDNDGSEGTTVPK